MDDHKRYYYERFNFDLVSRYPTVTHITISIVTFMTFKIHIELGLLITVAKYHDFIPLNDELIHLLIRSSTFQAFYRI